MSETLFPVVCLAFDRPSFGDVQPHILEKFLQHHKENPHIYELFKRFSYEAKSRWSHFGAGAIFERMRWETDAHSADGQFKLNNNFRSCYARLLIEEESMFKDFFETRHTPGTLAVH